MGYLFDLVACVYEHPVLNGVLALFFVYVPHHVFQRKLGTASGLWLLLGLVLLPPNREYQIESSNYILTSV